MIPRSLHALSVFLWLICAFHVMVGLGLNLWPSFPQVMAEYYGATVHWTPDFLYILKPLGAFMLVLGILAGVAATKPLANAPIIYGFVLLFALRSAQRIIHRGELADVFNIGAGRNLGNIVFFAAMALGLFLLLRAARRSPPA